MTPFLCFRRDFVLLWCLLGSLTNSCIKACSPEMAKLYFFPIRIYWLEARNFSSFLQFTKKKHCYISSRCLPNEQVGIANTTAKHCSLPTGQRWWCQTNLHAGGRKRSCPGPGVAALVGLEIRSLELKLGDSSPYFLGKGFSLSYVFCGGTGPSEKVMSWDGQNLMSFIHCFILLN